MNATLWILLGLVIVAFGVALARDRELPLQGLAASGRLLRGVWIELALGFLLAGLVDVLLPAATLSRWIGGDSLGRGLLVGWGAGLILPGGPYVLFPLVAQLAASGAAAGPLIAFVTAKTLVSPLRMLTYEAPLLGWPLTLARLLPALFLPPLLGLVGQALFSVFSRSGTR